MNNKKIIFFITFSFFLSLLISFNFINKLDVYESDGLDHHIIKGDIDDIWSRGAKFKNDLVSGKNFLISGTEVYRSYLPPRLIGFFSIIFDYELLTNDEKLTQIVRVVHSKCIGPRLSPGKPLNIYKLLNEDKYLHHSNKSS